MRSLTCKGGRGEPEGGRGMEMRRRTVKGNERHKAQEEEEEEKDNNSKRCKCDVNQSSFFIMKREY